MPKLRDTIPTLAVRHLAKAVAFYAEKLGFVARHQEEGFAIVCRDAAEIHLTQLNDERWKERRDFRERPVLSGAESFLSGTGACRIRVEGIDDLYAEYQQQGVIHPNGDIRDQWWGDRDFGVLDLDRNALTFFEPKALQLARDQLRLSK